MSQLLYLELLMKLTVTFSGTGTATEGSDYTTISDVTIASGQTSATTTITLINDNIYEGNETLGIQIDLLVVVVHRYMVEVKLAHKLIL